MSEPLRLSAPGLLSLPSLLRACTVATVALAIMLWFGLARAQPATVPEIRPGFLAGYLPTNRLPDSLALTPAPPAADSPAFALDEQISRKSLKLRGTARWMLAAEDADLRFPHAAATFSCALNTNITERDMPHLYVLLRRTLTDMGLSTYAAKNQYHRPRPFVVNNEPICSPEEEAALRSQGSYPSGHAAIGWGWALILSEIAPDRIEPLLSRGRDFGQSRVICNVHWESDVIEGRFMGAATVARLHADPHFLSDLRAAKAELARVRARGVKPLRDCTAEAAAPVLEPPSVP